MLDSLYEAPLESKGWVCFLQALECELEGGVAMLCMPAPSDHEPGTVIAPSLGVEFIESYRRQWFRCDPWLREAHGLPVGEVVLHEGRIGGHALAETPFYREWMAPQGLRPDRVLGAVGDRDAHHPPALLTVFRRTQGEPPAIGLLRELMPHLRRALRMHFRCTRLAAERGALAVALDRVPLGAIVVDRSLRVQWTNRSADRLLARREALVLDRDGLHATQPEDNLRLRRLLADAFEGTRRLGAHGALLFERFAGRAPLRASVSRVCSQGLNGPEVALAVIFVTDSEADVELPAEALGRFHGLTGAESALVRELANGRSLQEAAVRLNITEGTARQRLVQVFGKTGAARQSALLRLVLTGPESLLSQP